MNSQQSWQYTGAGKPLQMATAPILEPAAGQVLVKNRVIGLNPVDWKLVEYGHGAWHSGHIPGVDGAGEVTAVGAGVDARWLGKRVAYHADLTRDGSFAEYIRVDEQALIEVPASVSLQDAAAFPCPGLTAWQAVAKFPSLTGRHILVCGGGSGVGRLAIQLLLAQGAVVTATASPEHHGLLQQWGVANCVDYRDSEWKQQLSAMVVGGQFDGAIDLVGPDHAAGLFDLLGYGSHLVSVLGRVNPLGDAFAKCVSLHEIALGAIYQFGSERQFAELTRAGADLLAQIGDRRLVPSPAVSFAFTELDTALAQLRAGTRTQKYLVTLD